jgi:hypothetical protein
MMKKNGAIYAMMMPIYFVTIVRMICIATNVSSNFKFRKVYLVFG